MKKIIITLMLVTIPCFAKDELHRLDFKTNLKYTFKFDNNYPKWIPGEMKIPVSAEEALKISKKYAGKIYKLRTNEQFGFKSLEIVRHNGFYFWKSVWTVHVNGLGTAQPINIPVYVLFDGKPLKFELIKRKYPEEEK